MEIEYLENGFKFEKELNQLDEFTIEFCSILNELKLNYVVVSGYIAILFGRNRASEDIDIIVEKMDFKKFEELWKKLDLDCLNADNSEDAYKEYLVNNESLRFSKHGEFIPNIEFKFVKNNWDLEALNEKKIVILNENIFYISSTELNIAFKIYLGSDKDLEDASYVYEIFKDRLNMFKLEGYIKKLGIMEEYKKWKLNLM